MKAVLSMVLLCGVCLIYAPVAAEDDDEWRPIKKEVSINMRTLVYPADNIASLWVKLSPEKNSELYWRARNKLQSHGKDSRPYVYTTFLTQVDCAREMHREVSILFYNQEKNIIHVMNDTNVAWEGILPESSFSLIRRTVCAEGEAAALGAGKHGAQ